MLHPDPGEISERKNVDPDIDHKTGRGLSVSYQQEAIRKGAHTYVRRWRESSWLFSSTLKVAKIRGRGGRRRGRGRKKKRKERRRRKQDKEEKEEEEEKENEEEGEKEEDENSVTLMEKRRKFRR